MSSESVKTQLQITDTSGGPAQPNLVTTKTGRINKNQHDHHHQQQQQQAAVIPVLVVTDNQLLPVVCVCFSFMLLCLLPCQSV